MKQQSRLRLSVLAVALGTTAVFAGAYAALDQAAATKNTAGATAVTANETIVATPQQTVTTRDEPRIAEPAPIAVPPPAAAPAQPPITVTGQRLTEDERIQREVMDILASNDRLTGKVGVEAKDRVVMLSGYLMTSGQVWRAGRDAGRVMGVRYVVNEIRPRVGAVMN